MQEQSIFPLAKRTRVLERFTKQEQGKIPVVLFFNRQKKWKGLKQYMLVSITGESSLHQFFKVIEAKLQWAGYLQQNNRSLYLYVRNRQLIINDQKVRSVFEQYRSSDGWLELTLMSVNAFG